MRALMSMLRSHPHGRFLLKRAFMFKRPMAPSSFYKHWMFKDLWHHAEVGDFPRLRLLPNRMPEFEAILGRKLLLSRSRAVLDPVRLSRLPQIVV